jgi:MarR family transcriptional regulator, organic hydroperoxide resistance regulator
MTKPGKKSNRDFIRQQGNGGVGARLRRLSERIDREANAVYAHLGITFEQRWMALLMLLDERGEMTVGELARALAITQPSVSQTLRSLQAARIVSEKSDPRDGRLKLQRLTKSGLEFVGRVRPVWAALVEAANDLDREGIDLITPLDQVERMLDRKSLFHRALGYMKSPSKERKRTS